MPDDQNDFLKLVPGMKAVDRADLAEYDRAMREEAIPEMIKEVEMRKLLAAESRQRRAHMPSAEECESTE